MAVASKVVARPWLGPHHVYAQFALPERFCDDTFAATLVAPGDTVEIGAIPEPPTQYEPDTGGTGYCTVSEHAHTRVAFKYLLTGRFRELTEPRNWQLVVMRGRRPTPPAGPSLNRSE